MITIYPDARTVEVWAKIKALARREGKTASDIARDALEEYVKVHGEGNPTFALDKWVQEPDFSALPGIGHMFSPEELFKWPDAELVNLYARIAARKQEVAAELKVRRYELSA